jgi:hypothetical protein
VVKVRRTTLEILDSYLNQSILGGIVATVWPIQINLLARTRYEFSGIGLQNFVGKSEPE